MILLDTNALVWTLSHHARSKPLFAPPARLYVSPVALLELAYLVEVGRVRLTVPESLSAEERTRHHLRSDSDVDAWLLGQTSKPEEVRSVVGSHLDQVLDCTRGRGAVNGVVTIAWTVAERHASEVAVLADTIGDDRVASCLVGRVQQWRFPRSVTGSYRQAWALTSARGSG